MSCRLSALTWSVLLGENEAKMLRFVVGQYASALLSLKNVYVIVLQNTQTRLSLTSGRCSARYIAIPQRIQAMKVTALMLLTAM